MEDGRWKLEAHLRRGRALRERSKGAVDTNLDFLHVVLQRRVLNCMRMRMRMLIICVCVYVCIFIYVCVCVSYRCAPRP